MSQAQRGKHKRIPTIYLDTNILKFAKTSLPRLRPRKTIIDWGHAKSEMVVHDLIDWNPNTRIRDPEHRKEADLVESVAHVW